MKKISALIALALLAVAGTGLAVTCAQDNVPGATLLVPYFRVSRNGVTSVGTDIPDVLGQTDTLMAITNVSDTGLIVHATVWNKYSFPVLDFNIPLTAKDVVTFRMKDILNGRLNVNPNTQLVSPQKDPCGINQSTNVYAPKLGFGATTFIRFSNPDSLDRVQSQSVYAAGSATAPAFSGTFRRNVWDSLDESGDVTAFTSPGAFVIDDDNRCSGNVDGTFSGDFSGYITFDVVNYCTNFFPAQIDYYTKDAIATAGWDGHGPNAIMGDVFYIDSSAVNGNISGDPMVSLEFDAGLDDWTIFKTFYGRYRILGDDSLAVPAFQLPYAFIGDGREPLGQHYGFRYLSDAAAGLQTWALVWRSDLYNNPDISPDIDLCDWWANAPSNSGFGLWDRVHQLDVHTYDFDENEFVTTGGPSPGQGSSPLYIFLEAQRIDLLSNGDINPGGFSGGWIDLRMPGNEDNQAFVGVQHTGLAAFLSVGHGATLLTTTSSDLICPSNFGDLARSK
jgi:hypothetical protein